MPEPDNREPLVETISLPQEGEYLQNAIYEEVPCPPEVIENPEAENHCLLIMPGPDYEETDAAE